jgi:glycosyltransferase involved in cell wall biosynthesis
MAPRNVIIVNDSCAINGGQAKVAISSAAGLARKGLNVIFFAGQGPPDPSLAKAGVRVVCLDHQDIYSDPSRMRALVRGLWNRQAARRLKALLDEFDPKDTIAHCHGFAKVLSAAIGPVITGHAIPHVYTIHEYFLVCPNGGFFHYADNEICTRRPLGLSCLTTNCDSRNGAHKAWRVARQVTINTVGNMPRKLKNVIYISDVVRQTMEGHLAPETRTFFVRNPVDIEAGSPVDVAASDTFLFIGRMSPEKGATLMAQAARDLGAKAVFIGDGPDRARVREIYPQAILPGWLSPAEVHSWIRKSRCLVFPSVWKETLGLVALEALANGVPVISGRWTGVADAIVDGRNGLLLDELTPDTLAHAMGKMTPQAASSMGASAFELYWDSPPTPSIHLAALQQTYLEIMGG